MAAALYSRENSKGYFACTSNFICPSHMYIYIGTHFYVYVQACIHMCMCIKEKEREKQRDDILNKKKFINTLVLHYYKLYCVESDDVSR